MAGLALSTLGLYLSYLFHAGGWSVTEVSRSHPTLTAEHASAYR